MRPPANGPATILPTKHTESSVLLSAVIGQAMDFWGWRSWMQQGLSDDQIIELVAQTAAPVAATSLASER
jgi:hypothetical protein